MSLSKEKLKYYDKMMAQAPEGLDLEDWRAEILDDIASMDRPREIIDRKMTVEELDFMIDTYEKQVHVLKMETDHSNNQKSK